MMNSPRDEQHPAPALGGLPASDVLHLEASSEQRLAHIARLACRLFDVSAALIVLLAPPRAWRHACTSAHALSLGPNHPLYRHTLAGSGVLIVPDTRLDARFSDALDAHGTPALRFYAGCPLRTASGAKLGILCLLDRAPKRLSDEDVQALKDLAGWAENILNLAQLTQLRANLLEELEETRHQALLDPLTRLWNHGAIMDLLRRELARARREGRTVSVIMADLDHFKRINDSYGHLVGNTVLRAVAERLHTCLRSYDASGRYGGEEFMIILVNTDKPAACHIAEKIRACVAQHEIITSEGALHTTLSLGVATGVNSQADAETLIGLADRALYRAKHLGRNRVEVSDAADTPDRSGMPTAAKSAQPT